MITTVIGFFTFGGVAVNVLTLSGVLLNTMGGVLYVFSKYRDQVSMQLQKEFIGDHSVEIRTTSPHEQHYKEKLETQIENGGAIGNHVHEN